LSSYIWSSIIGNLSHIWLFGILSSSLLFPDMNFGLLIGSYLVFCLALLIAFAFSLRRGRRSGKYGGGASSRYDHRSA